MSSLPAITATMRPFHFLGSTHFSVPLIFAKCSVTVAPASGRPAVAPSGLRRSTSVDSVGGEVAWVGFPSSSSTDSESVGELLTTLGLLTSAPVLKVHRHTYQW